MNNMLLNVDNYRINKVKKLQRQTLFIRDFTEKYHLRTKRSLELQMSHGMSL
jgi:hypothetical protein